MEVSPECLMTWVGVTSQSRPRRKLTTFYFFIQVVLFHLKYHLFINSNINKAKLVAERIEHEK